MLRCRSDPPKAPSLRRSGLGEMAERFGLDLETIKKRFPSFSSNL